MQQNWPKTPESAAHATCSAGLSDTPTPLAACLAESYEASSFVDAAFDRGEPRGLEDVALITDGPLKAMACNLVRAHLLGSLGWPVC